MRQNDAISDKDNQPRVKVMPPLGCTPRRVVEERRLVELCEAVIRYHKASQPVRWEWMREMAYLAQRLDPSKGA